MVGDAGLVWNTSLNESERFSAEGENVCTRDGQPPDDDVFIVHRTCLPCLEYNAEHSAEDTALCRFNVVQWLQGGGTGIT